jgi:hypothetical protein
MFRFIKTRARWIPLFSLLLLSQCCCIVVPFSGQVNLNSPGLQEIVEAVRLVVDSNQEAGRLLGSIAALVGW